ncbi:MAG: hypothetical protein EXQ47_05960 [Bryobacterales bacterium]|nr:hypothetical protein [Bryobacterales bacterium]
MDLTRVTRNRFLRPTIAVALLTLNTPFLRSQNNNVGVYQGPGVSTPGVPEVGTRGGQQVDLWFFAGVSGVYDNSLRPLATDAKGNLTPVQNLVGVEVSGGAYGTHNFKRSQLGLDYHGAYRRYTENTYYNGSDQSLSLKYTYQSSRRVIFRLAESVGTLAYGNSGVGASAANDLGGALNRSAVFFDSRFNYLQSTASLTWL